MNEQSVIIEKEEKKINSESKVPLPRRWPTIEKILAGEKILKDSENYQTLPTENDIKNIQSWLKSIKKTHSHDTYLIKKNEIEKFFLWAIYHQNKELTNLTKEDISDFLAFILEPVPHNEWCSNQKRITRKSTLWKPFSYPIKKRNVFKFKLVIKQFYDFCPALPSSSRWLTIDEILSTEISEISKTYENLPIENDIKNIRAWLNYIKKSFKLSSYNYKKSIIEKFFLWAIYQAKKSLSELAEEDINNFLSFILNPVPRDEWCSRKKGLKRSNLLWKPFSYPIKKQHVFKYKVVIRQFYNFTTH